MGGLRRCRGLGGDAAGPEGPERWDNNKRLTVTAGASAFRPVEREGDRWTTGARPQHVAVRTVCSLATPTILQNVWTFVAIGGPRIRILRMATARARPSRPGSALLDRRQRADRGPAPGLARAAAAQGRASGSAPSRSSPTSSASAAHHARGAAAAVGRAPDPRRPRPRRRDLRGAHAERGHEPQPVGVDRADALGAVDLDARAARRAAVARGADRRPRRGQRLRRQVARLEEAIADQAGHRPGAGRWNAADGRFHAILAEASGTSCCTR